MSKHKKEENIAKPEGGAYAPAPEVKEPLPSKAGIAWLVVLGVAALGAILWFNIRPDEVVNEPLVEPTPVVESSDAPINEPTEVPTETETIGEAA